MGGWSIDHAPLLFKLFLYGALIGCAGKALTVIGGAVERFKQARRG